MKRFLPLSLLALVLAVLFSWMLRVVPPPTPTRAPSRLAMAEPATPPIDDSEMPVLELPMLQLTTQLRVKVPDYHPADYPLLLRLNAPDGSVTEDLNIVSAVLEQWRTNRPGRAGNPVGENKEITATLTGANRAKLDLIPPGHPAINREGELCDRWGTPYFFHALSGEEMAIRSAGPDREMYTADDTVLEP